jgi:hypothetical protein
VSEYELDRRFGEWVSDGAWPAFALEYAKAAPQRGASVAANLIQPETPVFFAVGPHQAGAFGWALNESISTGGGIRHSKALGPRARRELLFLSDGLRGPSYFQRLQSDAHRL